MTILVSGVAFAQEDTPTPIARYDASGDQLPSAFDANWTLSQTGSPSISVSGGQLTISSTDTTTDNAYWEWSSPGFTDQGWTLIMRAARGTSMDPSGRVAIVDVSDQAGDDPVGFSEAFAIGIDDAEDADTVRALRRGRGPEGGPSDLSVVRTYRYYQEARVSSSEGGHGYLEIDGEETITTGAGVQDIDGDYIRFGVFDLGSDPGGNEFVIESVELYGMAMVPPTPTPYPCSLGLVNCGFESGSLFPWVSSGGGIVDWGFCGPNPYEGDYHFGHVTNGGNISGQLYQVVDNLGWLSVSASCYAKDMDGCQNSDGTVTLGIDPTGGTNPTAETVQWGSPLTLVGSYQAVSSGLVDVAESSQFTVFASWDVVRDPEWSFVQIDYFELTGDRFVPSSAEKWNEYK